MRDHNPPNVSANPWFFYPFLVWVGAGGAMLAFFDRKQLFEAVNTHHSEAADTFMQNITNFGDAQAIIPVLLMLIAVPKLRNWWYFIAAVVCSAVPALVIQILKGIFNAPRPFEYYKADSSWIHFSKAWGDMLYHHSFPSGHSGGAFSLFCFLALLLPQKYRWVGLPLFLFALTVGYSRMYLAAHFFADVYAGSIVGTVVTLVLFLLMKKAIPRFYGRNERQMGVHEN